jgi:hypothetical protein
VDEEFLSDISLPEPEEEDPYASFMKKIPTQHKLSISNEISPLTTSLKTAHSSLTSSNSNDINNNQIKTTASISPQKSNLTLSSSPFIKYSNSIDNSHKQQFQVDSSFEEKKIQSDLLNKSDEKNNSNSNGAYSHQTMNELTRDSVSSNRMKNDQNMKSPDFLDTLLQQSGRHSELFEDIEEFEDDV